MAARVAGACVTGGRQCFRVHPPLFPGTSAQEADERSLNVGALPLNEFRSRLHDRRTGQRSTRCRPRHPEVTFKPVNSLFTCGKSLGASSGWFVPAWKPPKDVARGPSTRNEAADRGAKGAPSRDLIDRFALPACRREPRSRPGSARKGRWTPQMSWSWRQCPIHCP